MYIANMDQPKSLTDKLYRSIDKLPRPLKTVITSALLATSIIGIGSIPPASAQIQNEVYLPMLVTPTGKSFSPDLLGQPDSYMRQQILEINPDPSFRAATAVVYSITNGNIRNSCNVAIARDNEGKPTLVGTSHCYDLGGFVGFSIEQKQRGATIALYVPGVGSTQLDASPERVAVEYSPLDTRREDGIAFHELTLDQQRELLNAEARGRISLLELGSWFDNGSVRIPISHAGKYFSAPTVPPTFPSDAAFSIAFLRADDTDPHLGLCQRNSGAPIIDELGRVVGVYQVSVNQHYDARSKEFSDPLADVLDFPRLCYTLGFGYQMVPWNKPIGPNSAMPKGYQSTMPFGTFK